MIDIKSCEKHNPDYRLISIFRPIYRYKNHYCIGYVNLVYSIDNEGNHEGLEAYYYNVPYDPSNGFRASRYWPAGKIPIKYLGNFGFLKTFLSSCPFGYKVELADGPEK